jgi:hypothetical protein
MALAGVRQRYPGHLIASTFWPGDFTLGQSWRAAPIRDVDAWTWSDGARRPDRVAVRVGGVFDALGVRHTIGGSIAASFAGERDPRSTLTSSSR